MTPRLAALVLAATLSVSACGGGNASPGASETPAGSAPTSGAAEPPASATTSPEESDLPVRDDKICQDLDVAAVAKAAGARLTVQNDLVKGDKDPFLPGKLPHAYCNLKGSRSMELVVNDFTGTGTLLADVRAGVKRVTEGGFQDCGTVSAAQGFAGREATFHTCQGSTGEIAAFDVLMAPDWSLNCSMFGPGIVADRVKADAARACALVADSLAG